MYDPVLTFENLATAQSLRFIYGAKPFQNWEITQQDIASGESFLGMFPFRERGSVDNGAVASWSVSTVIWVGRKFDPAGTYSSLDETEKQKYDRRLKYLRALMETILQSICGDTDIEITDAEIFRELNRFDENTDVIGCNLSFTYIPDAENDTPEIMTVISDGLIYYRKRTTGSFYYIDYSSNGGLTWEVLVILQADEDVIQININDSPVGYREAIRDGDYCIDHELTELGFEGDENIDWENVYKIEK